MGKVTYSTSFAASESPITIRACYGGSTTAGARRERDGAGAEREQGKTTLAAPSWACPTRRCSARPWLHSP